MRIPHGGEAVLVDRTVAVAKLLRVFREEDQVVLRRNLGDDRAPKRALAVARASSPFAEHLQRRAEAGRRDEQQEGDRRGDQVPHNAIANLVIWSSHHLLISSGPIDQ